MAIAYHDEEELRRGPQPTSPFGTSGTLEQYLKDTGRQSYHWATIPEAYRNIQGIESWANDPSVDPNQKVQEYLGTQRAAGKVDQGDAAALSPRDSALQQVSQTYSSASSNVSPFTSGLRDILMQQLGVYSQAPTVNDPGIAENLAGQRLALQRSAERQQALGAEQRTLSGLSDSGFADTSRLGIEQARGEAEARGVGDVLGSELQNRRSILMGLLNSALASGDTESARALQLQIAQMGNELGQDQLAFNYSDLNARNNLQTLLALLNAA